jgi:hypothetical protein
MCVNSRYHFTYALFLSFLLIVAKQVSVANAHSFFDPVDIICAIVVQYKSINQIIFSYIII